jgi:hypothetical protein
MLYKSSWNSNNNKAAYKEYFECLRIVFVMFGGLLFWVFEFLTPFTLGALTFSFLIHFQQLFMCQVH